MKSTEHLVNLSRTKLSFARPVTSYARVQNFVASLIRSRSFHINAARIKNKRYLDIGCGPNTHKEFINLDYCWHPGIDVCWDLAQPLPLQSGSLQGIFTEHCLEHLPLAIADQVLGECRRLLQPGGVIRIVVPDGQLYLENYVKYWSGMTSIKQPYAEGLNYKGIYSSIMSVNEVFRSHGHLYIHDFNLLQQLLARHGFTQIKREVFQSGRDPALLIDTAYRAIESLYVEASVPKTDQ